MTMNILKNIKTEEALQLKEEVSYREGEIVSKTLVQNDHVSMTLFSFSKGEEISKHQSDGDAFVYVLDGVGKFTIGGKEHLVKEGECIVMPNHVDHALFAEENFKMLLTVVF